MERGKGGIMSGAITIIILGILVIAGEGRAPVLHEVGGDRFGWRPNVNFSDWAAHHLFLVGDWLYFGFDKQKLSVLEVNRTGYENCSESNYMTNITKGGRDVFNLTAARPYYFISGRGYCSRGVKLAITVLDAPPADFNNSTQPPPSNSLYKTRSPPPTTTASSTIITSHAASLPVPLPIPIPPSFDHFLIITLTPTLAFLASASLIV